jgi:hypothetical protein
MRCIPRSILAIIGITLVACSSGSDRDTSTTSIASGAPTTYPPLPTTTVASVPTVLIVGDFLTRDTEGLGLADAIIDIGWFPLIETAEDRSVAEGADVIENFRDLGALPRLTLVSLGAHDACLAVPIEETLPHIGRVAAIADEEHVIVWVNLQMKDCIARARAINTVLDYTAATTNNFFVADWATDAPIQRLEGDGIHYDRAGSEFRIDYYVSLLRMYGSR